MKVKPADPNAVIRDPQSKMRLPAEGGDMPDTDHWIRRTTARGNDDAECWKLEGKEWTRQMADGTVARARCVEPKEEPATPTGNEPVASLTLRGGK